ncbi:hypothetical protein GOBAR_AA04968 [Gossypium barbadense]|uniref:Uncharacterized protein n=1 Tax=Gossypium barbadense TaxID=3634 RepID=A0A2P5YJ33_GOSBA|nr:hypothetical protein GOBAR_AA04968 [Gossypium barbadense]
MTVRHRRVHQHTQGTWAWGNCQPRPNSKFANHIGKIKEHGRAPWPCVPKSINTLHYSSSSSPKIPNPSRSKSTRPLYHAHAPLPTPFLTLILLFLVYHVIFTRKESHCPCFEEKEKPTLMTWEQSNFASDGLVHQFNVPEFGTALGLYTEEFMEENELQALNRHIHHSPSRCWNALTLGAASYNPSRSKASALPPSLRKVREHWHRQHSRPLLSMVYVALAHHGPYFLHCPRIQHQTERHKKGVISIGPYETRLA